MIEARIAAVELWRLGTILDLRAIDGLERIDLHPPAAGPELALIFDDAGGLREVEVDRLLDRYGVEVLAIRTVDR